MSRSTRRHKWFYLVSGESVIKTNSLAEAEVFERKGFKRVTRAEYLAQRRRVYRGQP